MPLILTFYNLLSYTNKPRLHSAYLQDMRNGRMSLPLFLQIIANEVYYMTFASI